MGFIGKIGLALVFYTVNVSHAATISVNATWDANQAVSIVTLAGGAVSVANGDHVILNVDLLGDQALSIVGNSNYGFGGALFAGDNYSSFTIKNVSLDLYGFTGTNGALASYGMASQSLGKATLGPEWLNVITVGQSATFDGFKVEFDVQSIEVSPHSYRSAIFWVDGPHSVGTRHVSAVPEPESYALMLAGLGLIGLTAARRKKWNRINISRAE